MSDERKTRQVARKRWTCPNHPEGRPRIVGQGYEAEDVEVADALPDTLAAMKAIRALGVHDANDEIAVKFERAWQELGLCCEGHEWEVVGYDTVEISVWEEMLLSDPMIESLRRSLSTSVFWDSLPEPPS